MAPPLPLFCEDDEDELHRRQHAINLAYDIDFDQLDGMTWTSGVGDDNTLVEFDTDGRMVKTRAFEKLADKATDTGAKLIVVDTAADTFGGQRDSPAGKCANTLGPVSVSWPKIPARRCC